MTSCEGVKEFNEANPGLNAKLLEFPESADEQRNQFIQRQRAKSADCDAFESDVVWTAEFASQKWLLDMTPYIEKRKAEFVPSTLSSVDYEGKIWGVPRVTDAGLLYYRKDKVKDSPRHLAGRLQAGQGRQRHRLPGRGLRGPDGELPRAGLRGRRQDPLRRRQEVRHRLAREPEGAAVHGRRHQGRRGSEGRDDLHGGGGPPHVRGRPRRLRCASGPTPTRSATRRARRSRASSRWPRTPTFEGGGKAAILGGHNSVISAYSKNPGGALKLIDYLTSEKRMTKNATDFSKTPVLERVLRGPGGQEGAAVHRRAQAGGRAGQEPARLAGLHPDLAGHLQERERRSVGVDGSEGCALEGAGRHGQGTGHLLGEPETNGSRLHQGRLTAEEALQGHPGAPPRGPDGVAVTVAHRNRGGVPHRVRGLALVARVQRARGRALAVGGLQELLDRAPELRVLGRGPDHVRLHGLLGAVRDAPGAGDGPGDALGVQGPGTAAHRRAGAVGRPDGRHGHHLADDLRADAGLREQPARRGRAARRHRVAGRRAPRR